MGTLLSLLGVIYYVVRLVLPCIGEIKCIHSFTYAYERYPKWWTGREEKPSKGSKASGFAFKSVSWN